MSDLEIITEAILSEVDEKEKLRRERVVKGWAFRGHSEDEKEQIRTYLRFSAALPPAMYAEADRTEPLPK